MGVKLFNGVRINNIWIQHKKQPVSSQIVHHIFKSDDSNPIFVISLPVGQLPTGQELLHMQGGVRKRLDNEDTQFQFLLLLNCKTHLSVKLRCACVPVQFNQSCDWLMEPAVLAAAPAWTGINNRNTHLLQTDVEGISIHFWHLSWAFALITVESKQYWAD